MKSWQKKPSNGKMEGGGISLSAPDFKGEQILTIGSTANSGAARTQDIVLRAAQDPTKSITIHVDQAGGYPYVTYLGLDWMTENISGFDGKYMDGFWYYRQSTWDNILQEIGDRWAVPTKAQFETLISGGYTWDDARKGMQFGPIFFPANGYIPVTLIGDEESVIQFGETGAYLTSTNESLFRWYILTLTKSGVNLNTMLENGFSLRLCRPHID